MLSSTEISPIAVEVRLARSEGLDPPCLLYSKPIAPAIASPVKARLVPLSDRFVDSASVHHGPHRAWPDGSLPVPGSGDARQSVPASGHYERPHLHRVRLLRIANPRDPQRCCSRTVDTLRKDRHASVRRLLELRERCRCHERNRAHLQGLGRIRQEGLLIVRTRLPISAQRTRARGVAR